MIKTKLSLMLLLAVISWKTLQANKVQITDIAFEDGQTLSFSLSWDNSWLTTSVPGNHDAVWVFVKYKENRSNWNHLPLSEAPQDYKIDPEQGLTVLPVGSAGVLIKRSREGAGSISARLRISLPAAYPPDDVAFRIMGIEMVYIPEGPFYLGDSASINSFSRGDRQAPFKVTGAGAVDTGSTSFTLSAQTENAPEAPVPAAYPKGYKAFYAMKYEITQSQYADFLNQLPFAAQNERTSAQPDDSPGTFAMQEQGAARNGIVISRPGEYPDQPAKYACNLSGNKVYNEAGDGQNLPANWLNWGDISAYLDWAGLRPMTELEFEKICRGPEMPVPGEMAWGTPVSRDANTIINAGFPDETVKETAGDTAGLANHGYQGVQGPIRSGFGAHDSSGRLQAGAAYYGVMEMSGNVWELCVNVSNDGLQFTGNNGDGHISTQGYANAANWPASGTAHGACYRGGAFLSGVFEVGSFRDIAISDRYYTGLKPDTRRKTAGGRGVLTLP